MTNQNIKNNVREFYDQVGWQKISDECFQNAQYEDLRPVSREYIHRAHMRVKRHLLSEGKLLLDAGSGPVQYPEYLTYSEGYQARVCMDISIVALKEARKRIGEHGMYVVGDIAHLPFKSNSFDGIVSLHTIHHVPMEDKIQAYEGLYRTLTPGSSMVIVNGWTNAPLMSSLNRFSLRVKKLRSWYLRRFKNQAHPAQAENIFPPEKEGSGEDVQTKPQGTYIQKLNAEWLTQALKDRMEFQILVWRSVSVSFLRSVIYPDWGGRFWLKVLYWIEELFPQLLGRVGQYPLIVIKKPDA